MYSHSVHNKVTKYIVNPKYLGILKIFFMLTPRTNCISVRFSLLLFLLSILSILPHPVWCLFESICSFCRCRFRFIIYCPICLNIHTLGGVQVHGDGRFVWSKCHETILIYGNRFERRIIGAFLLSDSKPNLCFVSFRKKETLPIVTFCISLLSVIEWAFHLPRTCISSNYLIDGLAVAANWFS